MSSKIAQMLVCAAAVMAWIPSRPDAATSLVNVAPGTTTRAQMAQLFGEPAEGGGTLREVFDASEQGFALLAVLYDGADTVRRAEFVPARAFSPEQAELLFDLRSKARQVAGFDLAGGEAPVAAMGATRHYDADGLRVYAVDNRVASIVLTVPGGEGEGPAPSDAGPPTAGPEGPDPTGADPAGISLRLPDFAAEPSQTPDPLQRQAASAARAGRVVRLLSVASQAEADFEGHPSILIHATLQAQGLNGQTMVFQARPTLLDGTPVKAAPGTPARHVASDGSLVLNLEDQVRFAEAIWNPWRGFIVHRWMALPSGAHELVLHITATCGDASSRSQISQRVVLP